MARGLSPMAVHASPALLKVRDQPRMMVVRPEKFALRGESAGMIAATVVGLVYVGDFTRYLVEIAGGQRLIVKAQNRRSDERMREGQQVGLQLDPADARLLAS